MNEEFQTFFHLRVRQPFEDYLRERKSLVSGRKRDIAAATEAAKVLYHLRERVPPPFDKTWDEVAAACPDYKLIRDVADAEKHGTLKDKNRSVCDAKQIEERIVSTLYQDAEGEYAHTEKSVWLSLTDGSSRELIAVLTNVINYWQDELHKLGLLPKLPPYPNPSTHPKPRSECNNGKMG